MGANGEREITWEFHRGRKLIHNLQHRDPELGTKDTPQLVWELRIRELEEEEGWTTVFPDGSGLDNKAAGAFCPNPTRPDKERNPEDLSGDKYLGTRATHIDGELEGIALALETHNEKRTGMLAILSDCRPAIRTVEKLDAGLEGPRSHIEARIQKALESRETQHLETHISWVKGHKDIKGNEAADKLSKKSSILGHESEGVVTPAGLKAWARRVRAEARGGSREGVLGWHRKAISAYTWCVTEKGPQQKWLHKLKKKDTPECQCGHPEQSGEHLVERCELLEQKRKLVERDEMREWKTRHSRNQLEKKKKEGPIGPEKEEEEDKLESFFCHVYEFHNPAPATPAFVPADLPPRYAIDFVPATSVSTASASVPVSAADVPVVPNVPALPLPVIVSTPAIS